MKAIVSLHGFFGHPTDWSPLFGPSGTHRIYANIFEDYPIQPFDRWAPHFNKQVADNIPKETPKVLVGYSLGGRLALHALKSTPQQWDSAVIISAHPGLSDYKEKQLRIHSDAMWVEKIRTMSWDALMQEWNALKIFAGDTIHPSRNESDYNREKLAQALTIWSLGVQEDLHSTIASLQIPILWVVGEHDTNFREKTAALRLSHRSSRILTIKDAGHRVPWYNQETFREKIYEFINRGSDDNDS